MDSEEQALRNAIIHGTPDGLHPPGDKTTSLVYADWLDERGRGVEALWQRRNPAAVLLQEIASTPNEREPLLRYANWLEGRNEGADVDRAAYIRLRAQVMNSREARLEEREELALRQSFALLLRSAPLRDVLCDAARMQDYYEPVVNYLRGIPGEEEDTASGANRYAQYVLHSFENMAHAGEYHRGASLLDDMYSSGLMTKVIVSTLFQDEAHVREWCERLNATGEPVREITLELGDKSSLDAMQAFTPSLPSLRKIRIIAPDHITDEKLGALLKHITQQPEMAHLHELALMGNMMRPAVVEALQEGGLNLNRLQLQDGNTPTKLQSAQLKKLIASPMLAKTIIDLFPPIKFPRDVIVELAQHNVKAGEAQGFRYEIPYREEAIIGSGVRGYFGGGKPKREVENPTPTRKHGNHHFLKPETEASITDISRHRSGEMGLD